MSAQIIDGFEIARQERERVAREERIRIEALKEQITNR